MPALVLAPALADPAVPAVREWLHALRAPALRAPAAGIVAGGLTTTQSLADRSDEALAALAAGAGSDARVALDALFGRYQAKVMSFALRFTGDSHAAQDLSQEIFLRVQTRLAGFRGESRFSTWLYTVARSIAVNRGLAERRRRAEPLDFDAEPDREPQAPGQPPEERLDRDRRLAALRHAMTTALDADERRIVVLHLVHGMTLPAIARALGLTNRSGAKAPLVRAVRKLRRAVPTAFLALEPEANPGAGTPDPRGTDR